MTTLVTYSVHILVPTVNDDSISVQTNKVQNKRKLDMHKTSKEVKTKQTRLEAKEKDSGSCS